jgi:hypothetical protein
MSEELVTKQEVQLLRVFENVVKIRIPIIIFNGRSVSASPLRITNTKKKIAVKASGSKRDQK